MEAKYDNWQDGVFDALSELYNNTQGTYRVIVLSVNTKDRAIDPYTKNLIDNGIIKTPKFNESKGLLEVTIETIEPAYTYYSYHHMGRLNTESTINHIGDLIKSSPIEPDRLYLCSLSIDSEQYIYLNWDNSRLRVHDLGSKKNTVRKKVINHLITTKGIISFNEIRDSLEIKDISKGYKSIKDVLSTSFLQTTLREKFVISSSKSNIGIRQTAEISGSDLIKIIREQLYRIEHSDKNNFKRKFEKINTDFASVMKISQDI